MQDALRDNAALLTNSVLMVLALLAGLFWLVRRQDMMFAWLGIYAGLWFVANLQFIVTAEGWIHTAGIAATYLLAVALAGFLIGFIIFVARSQEPPPLPQSLVLLCAAVAGLSGIIFEATVNAAVLPGPGFPVTPLAGLLSVVIVSVFLGQRILQLLSTAEDMNVMLENRARAANASLAASEAARRALEVSGAITKERDRLMREIHDGIGSSFITAIAASERRGGAVDPVAVLKGALTDLRIAVDSLEPVQGDVATLLASLRYRVEPDFRKAGIAFDWRVEEVPELSWLDPVNSLQVLRIFQEAFGNIAAHSGATSITVRCLPMARDGRDGILIEVKDNGTGYEDTGGRKGHGLKNMNRRAATLGGELTMTSSLGEGTSVALWIPLER
jgi:signal transduction histidine kinase